jgi:ATP-dependent DNA helicase RecQ
MHRAEKILNQVFGYHCFRPLQHKIIENVLGKNDSLVVMPTGGGKSLCYQIPALIYDGLTIVISPLISLMKDQVMQLRLQGVEAAVLNSSLTRTEYNSNYNMVLTGKSKMLYLAPESLGRDDILQLLKKVEVDCLAVDEAHCISEWGHDFRKDYRQLGNLREKFNSAVCIALTATATPKVQDDIISNLNMKNGSKFLGSFNRENLFLEVKKKNKPVEQLLDFLQERKGQSGIIYCFSRAQVDDLSTTLTSHGFSNLAYHAGLSDKERNNNQDLFIKETVDIIVATIAFGMGINKSNVRFIVHYDLPKNLESYYQEIGRSGRDGMKADCLLLFSYADIRKIRYFINEKESDTERKSAEQHLQSMIDYADSKLCRRIRLINYFGEKFFTDNCGMCDNCIEARKHLADLTIPAQKFLSAVKRTGEIFGAGYIADLLTGSSSEKIIKNNHDKLSVYNIGTGYNKKTWMELSKLFEMKELLKRGGEYGSLKVTGKGMLVLKGQLSVQGILRETEMPLKTGGALKGNLFEMLKKKRKEIAGKLNIPPFMIFSDNTLAHMCLKIPLNEIEMLAITGVGRRKLETFGEAFLSIIKEYYHSNKEAEEIRKRNRHKFKTQSSVRSSRAEDIATAFNSGTTIENLAEEYNVKQERIYYHLLNYCLAGNKIETGNLKQYISLSENQKEEAFKAFDEQGTQKLATLYFSFNGTISYNELRALIMIYIQKKR